MKSPAKYYLSFVRLVNSFLWNETAIASRPLYLRYGFPTLLIILATFIKLYYFNIIGINTPFLLYFAIVIVATGFGGSGPGLFATFLLALISSYYFIPPLSEWQFSKLFTIAILVFIIECLLLISLSRAVSRAGDRVRRSARRFRSLIENSNDAIAVINSDNKIVYASKATERIMGYKVNEFKKIHLWDLVHPEEVDLVQQQINSVVVNSGASKTILSRCRHKDSRWIWIESTLTNLLEDPVIKGIVSNFRDVTERIILEKQKDDFVGIATHELKTPVTSIKAYAQILLARFYKEGNASAAGLVEKMDAQLNKLIGLIADLLDVTKIEGGRLQIQAELYDLNEVIQESVEEIQRTTVKHKIETVLTTLPQLIGDRERIGQVIINLVSNAIKYSPRSELILVTSKRDTLSVIISVKDQGVGISSDQQPHVFERFYRVAGPDNNSYPGLGLGLFICHEIVTRQGGEIWVESEPGKGSEFFFSLPILINLPVNS